MPVLSTAVTNHPSKRASLLRTARRRWSWSSCTRSILTASSTAVWRESDTYVRRSAPDEDPVDQLGARIRVVDLDDHATQPRPGRAQDEDPAPAVHAPQLPRGAHPVATRAHDAGPARPRGAHEGGAGLRGAAVLDVGRGHVGGRQHHPPAERRPAIAAGEGDADDGTAV